MSVVVAEGEVVVRADATRIPREVARDIDANGAPLQASGVGMGRKIFGGVLAGWAAIGGINAVVGFFSGAVTGASDLNETMSASGQIFGTSAASIATWGDTASRSVGLSKQAAVDAALGFGNMFTQLGWTSEAAAKLSINTVQVASDLGSFRNLTTADVTDRISAALRGEYDSLQLLIPNINAARVQQEALTATGKTSAAQLTAQDKATATLAIVQRDGAAAMGDFARTSDGAANSAKIVNAEFADQQQKLGGQLLPIWQSFLSFLSTTAIPAFSSVVDWVGKNSDALFALGTIIAVTATAYGIATVAGTAYKAFQIANAAATGGLTVAQWALNVAMAANPIGLIVIAIGALVAGIVWVATQTTFFQDAWAVMTEVVGTAWSWLWDNVLNPVFTAMGAIFTWLYENIIVPVVTGIAIYVGIWAAIFVWLWETMIAPVFANIGAIFTWLYENIIVPVVGLIVAYVEVWGAIFTWLYESVISPVFTALGVAFNWVWGNVIQPVVGFITGAINLVGSTVSSVFGGIASFIGNAFNAALGMVRGPLNGIIGLVNGAIGAINGLRVTIPSWVPIVGGQTWGLNLPKIPMLARGAMNAPDMFIAGENGPELITGAGGARVYSNSQTRDMLAGGGGGFTVQGNVVLDASNIKSLQDLLDMLDSIAQAARSGRGTAFGGAY